MKKGDVISWRTGRAGFGQFHRVVAVNPPRVWCGQVIPDGALVNVLESPRAARTDLCHKCWAVPGDKEGSASSQPGSGEQAPTPGAVSVP